MLPVQQRVQSLRHLHLANHQIEDLQTSAGNRWMLRELRLLLCRHLAMERLVLAMTNMTRIVTPVARVLRGLHLQVCQLCLHRHLPST